MDVNTLPDEMLTNILKFMDSENGTVLRKASKRIDKLARRAKLYGKIEVETITFIEDYIKVFLREEYAKKKNLKKLYSLELINESQHLEILEEGLKVIFKVKHLKFMLRPFSDRDVQLITKHKKSLRNVKTFVFENVDLDLSKSSVKALIRKICPNVEEIRLDQCQNSERIFDAELLSNRKWRSLVLFAPNLLLDDNFLLKVVANCEKAELRLFHSLFTVRGVLNMLKKCFIDGNDKQDIKIQNVQLHLVHLDEIEPLFKAEIPGIDIEIDEYMETRWYDITVPDKSKRCVFYVEILQLGM